MSGSSVRRELLPSQTSLRKKDDTEKRGNEWRKYAKISTDSIKMISDVSGILGFNDEMANKISDDVTYRLRELLHHTSIFLRHSKRKKLLASDIQEVLEDYDVSPLFGHTASQKGDLVYLSEADLFVVNDEEEDLLTLALESKELFQLGDPFTKDSTVSPVLQEVPPIIEPQPIVKQEEITPTLTAPPPPTPPSTTTTTHTEEVERTVKLPPHLLAYYNRVTSVLLGCSKNHYEVIMSDFLINNKIGPVVPYLLNMLAMGLQKIPSMRSRFLHSVLVLTRNKSIELNCTVSVHRLVSALLLCALETKVIQDISIDDEYHLKSEAAVVLSKVVGEWCKGESKLQLDIVQKLGSYLLNGSSSLKSHYGALACLVSLGSEALEYCLWPHLAQYLSYLETKPQDRQVKEVEGAILNASENLYRFEWETISEPSTLPQGIKVVDRLLESYFGDALCSRRVCQGVRTYEENYSRDAANLGLDHGKLNSNEAGETYTFWGNTGKTRLFPSYQSNKETPDEEATTISLTLHLTKKNDLSDIFDTSLSNSPKVETEAIQMNFAGGKPVPQDRLVRRCVDKNHSQFTGPSLYAMTNYEAGCTGPRLIIPKSSRRSRSGRLASNEELLIVL